MALPPGKTCAGCAHVERCVTVLGCTSRSATSCDWAPSRFIERPIAPAARGGGYVSPLDPPAGDPRAAHKVLPGTRECAPDCPCWASRGGR